MEHEKKTKENNKEIKLFQVKNIFQRNLKCKKNKNIPLQELSWT